MQLNFNVIVIFMLPRDIQFQHVCKWTSLTAGCDSQLLLVILLVGTSAYTMTYPSVTGRALSRSFCG